MDGLLLWICIVFAAASCARSQGPLWDFGPAFNGLGFLPEIEPLEQEFLTTTPRSRAQYPSNTANKRTFMHQYDPSRTMSGTSNMQGTDPRSMLKGGVTTQGNNPQRNVILEFYKLLLQKQRNGYTSTGMNIGSNTSPSSIRRNVPNQLELVQSPHGNNVYVPTHYQSKANIKSKPQPIQSYENVNRPSNNREINSKLTNTKTEIPYEKSVLRNSLITKTTSEQASKAQALKLLHKLLRAKVPSAVNKGVNQQENAATAVYKSEMKQRSVPDHQPIERKISSSNVISESVTSDKNSLQNARLNVAINLQNAGNERLLTNKGSQGLNKGIKTTSKKTQQDSSLMEKGAFTEEVSKKATSKQLPSGQLMKKTNTAYQKISSVEPLTAVIDTPSNLQAANEIAENVKQSNNIVTASQKYQMLTQKQKSKPAAAHEAAVSSETVLKSTRAKDINIIGQQGLKVPKYDVSKQSVQGLETQSTMKSKTSPEYSFSESSSTRDVKNSKMATSGSQVYDNPLPEINTADKKSPVVKRQSPVAYISTTQAVNAEVLGKKPSVTSKPDYKKQTVVELSGTLSSKSNLLNVPPPTTQSDQKQTGTGSNENKSLKYSKQAMKSTSIDITGGKKGSRENSLGIPDNQPSPKLYSSFPQLLPSSYKVEETRANQNTTEAVKKSVDKAQLSNKDITKSGQSTKVNDKTTKHGKSGKRISATSNIQGSLVSSKMYQTEEILARDPSNTASSALPYPQPNKEHSAISSLNSYPDKASLTDAKISKTMKPGSVQSSVDVGTRMVSKNTQAPAETLYADPANPQYWEQEIVTTTSTIFDQHKTDKPLVVRYSLESSTPSYGTGEYANVPQNPEAKQHVGNYNLETQGLWEIPPSTGQKRVGVQSMDSTHLKVSGENKHLSRSQQNTLPSYTDSQQTSSYAATANNFGKQNGGNSSNLDQGTDFKDYLMVLGWLVDAALKAMTTTQDTMSGKATIPTASTPSSRLGNAVVNAQNPYINSLAEPSFFPTTKSSISIGRQQRGNTMQDTSNWQGHGNFETQYSNYDVPWAHYPKQQVRPPNRQWLDRGATNAFSHTTSYEFPARPARPSTSRPNDIYGCNLSPVCGNDGTTYLSHCFLPADVIKDCDGVCPCPIRPQTPPNFWNQASRLQQRLNSKQTAGSHTMGSAGGTPGSSMNSQVTAACISQCPAVYNPVCSTLGKTFDSDCHLACSNQTKMCNTTCPCEFEEILPAIKKTLVHIDELLGAANSMGQNRLQHLIPNTPQCACPAINPNTLFVCTSKGQTMTTCQVECLRETIQCHQQCPCNVEW